MNSKLFLMAMLCVAMVSCVSTKSTLKNVDDNAPAPRLKADNTFVINVNSTDKKYGYDKDYPVNVFFRDTKSETLNIERFLNALAGPKGEPITYKKIETCCPFPTKRTEIGAGFLDVYEVSWEGNAKPLKLYLNIYEKSVLMVPVGLTL
ncbi:MAG TPA: 2-dehydro-3-deoxyphosphooctonate aldolase, partial [Flavobacterium sp.]|nr:2-dehydro-3-deoxyphosphooctonate aldolase [Flavobacterium sp.]